MKNIYPKACVVTAIIIFISAVISNAATYNVSSNGGSFNSGGAWNTTSACGAGGLSWPTTSADAVNINCSGKTITAGSASQTCGAITILSGTLIVNSACTLYCTSLSMTSGTLTVNGTLNIASGGTGAFSISGGTFTQGSGTVILSAGSQTLSSSQAFYNLNIAGSGDKTMGTDITVSNQLTLTSNNLVVGSHTLTCGSSFLGTNISQSNGHITTTSGSSFNFGGSIVQTLGTLLSNSWPVTLNNFTMTSDLVAIALGSNQNLTVGGALNLSAGGDLVIGANTLTLNGSITCESFGFLTGSDSSNVIIGGSGTVTAFQLDPSPGAYTLNNLTVTRSNTVSLGASFLIISGVLNLGSGSSLTLYPGVYSLTLNGTVTGTGTITGSPSSYLAITGSGALGTLYFTSGAQTLANFSVNRILNGTVILGSALATGTLGLSSGLIILSSGNDLTVSPGGSILGNAGSNTNMVVTSGSSGMLKQTITTTSDSAYTYPIGTSDGTYNVYSGFTFSSVSNSAAHVLGFKAIEAGAPNLGSPLAYVTRYWTSSLSNQNGSYTYSMSLPYSIASPDDRHGVENKMVTAYYNSGWWYAGPVDTSAHLLVISGATNASAPLGNIITGTSDANGILSVNNKALQQEEILLYPNPAGNQLTLYALQFINKSTLDIYNMLGERMISSSLSFGEGRGEVFNISSLAQGVYFLRVNTGDTSLTKTFIKQ